MWILTKGFFGQVNVYINIVTVKTSISTKILNLKSQKFLIFVEVIPLGYVNNKMNFFNSQTQYTCFILYLLETTSFGLVDHHHAYLQIFELCQNLNAEMLQ